MSDRHCRFQSPRPRYQSQIHPPCRFNFSLPSSKQFISLLCWCISFLNNRIVSFCLNNMIKRGFGAMIVFSFLENIFDYCFPKLFNLYDVWIVSYDYIYMHYQCHINVSINLLINNKQNILFAYRSPLIIFYKGKERIYIVKCTSNQKYTTFKNNSPF